MKNSVVISFNKSDRKGSDCYDLIIKVRDLDAYGSPVVIRLTEAKAKKIMEEASFFIEDYLVSDVRSSVVQAFPISSGIKIYYGKGVNEFFVLPNGSIQNLIDVIGAQF